MQGDVSLVIATRNSWEREQYDGPFRNLSYELLITDKERIRIERGVVPVEMEDKWFVFFENPFLFFHRSWTGHLIYQVEIRDLPAGPTVCSANVVDDGRLYRRRADEYEVLFLDFLIRGFILGQPVPFPVPNETKGPTGA